MSNKDRDPTVIEGPASGRGKWGDPRVPRGGWTCVEIEDLGQVSNVCGMCETMEIRYVHYMEHPRYSGVLACGCICAGYMEENRERAEVRDRSMRNAARRRANWPNRKAWSVSQKGNPTIRLDRQLVTIFPKRDGFSALIVDRWSEKKTWARRLYPTETAAKLAAFDFIVKEYAGEP